MYLAQEPDNESQAEATPAALAVLAKGRLLEPTRALWARAGLGLAQFAGRSLYSVSRGGRLLLSRGRDVPLYVRSGAAELGVAGRDVILESGEGLVELLDLGFGRCRLVLAGPAGMEILRPGLRVASRYPLVARRYFAERGLRAQVIPLAGAVEASVEAGLADVIVDIAETGRTLDAHGLVVLDVIADSSARLVARQGRPLGEAAGEAVRRLEAALQA
jgi:ATP phosphoribosyltransferase